MGVLKSLEQGWSLVRIIAQSDAVKEARDRVLNRIAEQAERISQSGLVPRVISAPAEIVAELIARRPPKPVESWADDSAAVHPSAQEPRVDDPIDKPASYRAPAPQPVEAPSADVAPPTVPETPEKSVIKKPKPVARGKKPAAKASGVTPQTSASKTSKKPKSGSKKVRDKAGDLK